MDVAMNSHIYGLWNENSYGVWDLPFKFREMNVMICIGQIRVLVGNNLKVDSYPLDFIGLELFFSFISPTQE